MGRLINAVVCGFVIAIGIIFLLPSNTSFVAYFLASIIVLYFFGIKEIEHGMLVALSIYVITEWIFGSISVTSLLLSGETITLAVDEWIVFSQMTTTLFVLLGGMVGSELAVRKQRTVKTLSPSPIPMPPPSTMPVPPSPTPAADSAERKFCRYCGGENKIDAIFCEKCGKKIQ